MRSERGRVVLNRAPSLRAQELSDTIEAFVNNLRRDGYTVSIDALSAATGIFLDEVARSPDDLKSLRDRLTPIFATSPQSQADIGRRIDAFASGVRADLQREFGLGTTRFRRSAIFGLTAILLLGIVVWLSIQTLPDFTGGAAPSEQIREVDSEFLPPSVDLEIFTPIPLLDAVDILDPRELVKFSNDPDWRVPWLIGAAVAVPMLIALFWWWFRVTARRRWVATSSLESDMPRYFARTFGRQGIPINNAMSRTAAKLQSGLSDVTGSLDIEKSVRATAEAAGFVTLVEEERGFQSDYVVLVQRIGPNDHMAQLVGLILDRIENSGIRIRRYYYREDPRLCLPDPRSKRPVPFRQLSKEFGRHRFLVIGASDGFYHPRTGKFLDWNMAEETFRSRALLTTRRPEHWSYREQDLKKRGFLVSSASPTGMASYSDAVSAERDTHPELIRPSRYGAEVQAAVFRKDKIDEVPVRPGFIERLKRILRQASDQSGYASMTGFPWKLSGGLNSSKSEGSEEDRFQQSGAATIASLSLGYGSLLSPITSLFGLIAYLKRLFSLLSRHLVELVRGMKADRTVLTRTSIHTAGRLATPALLAVLIVAASVLSALWLSGANEAPTFETRATDEEITRADFQTFSDCEACPPMIVIPSGTFVMGSPSEDEMSLAGERPQRSVQVDRFALARTPVTFDQWQACVADQGCKSNPRPDNQGWGRETRPVINVSWNDAQEFIQWLNSKVQDANPYRLPAEAEWEYAARAGTSSRYPWGDEASRTHANYGTEECCDGHAEGPDRWKDETAPVGSFEPNAFGLLDMHGNVFEWVEDCWSGSYEGAPVDGSARLSGPGTDCSLRVLRGGSWLDDPQGLRSASRGRVEPEFRSYIIGFRPARTLFTP